MRLSVVSLQMCGTFLCE